jgi:hypothetical protein
MEQDDAEFRAANERITAMVEELRKAELVRDRLEDLAQLMGSYPEGHDMRARLDALQVDRALEGVDEDIRVCDRCTAAPAWYLRASGLLRGTPRPEGRSHGHGSRSLRPSRELAALKADAHHWLTDPEYATLRHRLEVAHVATEAALVVQLSTYQRSLIGCLDCETREERWRGGLLPPSGRSTQVGTMRTWRSAQ